MLPDSFGQHASTAAQTLTTNKIPVPDRPRLELVALAAAESVYLLFQAALHEPSPQYLEYIFACFVLAATDHGLDDHDVTF